MNDKSDSVSLPVGEISRMRRPIIRVLEILFTAALSAILTVVVTLYIQRSSAPQLTIDYAWCLAKVVAKEAKGERFSMPREILRQSGMKPGSEYQYISFVYDIKTQAVLPDNTYLISVKANQPNAYTYDPNVAGYVGRMMVANDGKTTATNIRIGVSYQFPAVFEIKVSPNVHAALVPYDLKKANQDNSYWPYRNEIQIENLAPAEKAFITLSWSLRSTDSNVRGEVPRPGRWLVPEFVYFSSKETLGRVRSFLPYKSLVDLQANAMSETMPPFYSTPFVIKKENSVQMKAELLPPEKTKITIEAPETLPDNPSAPRGLR